MKDTESGMKTYLPNETKAERKIRKAREKAGLSIEVPQVHETYNTRQKNYVVCLKWGTKYGPEYVNKLYNMVKRNITVPFEFVCFTDSSAGIDKNIQIQPLPTIPAIGWWYKPYFFSAELPIKGTILFLDLDVIVFKNIDHLFSYKPGKFCIIRDFNRSMRPTWDRMNSSVFRLETGMYDRYWQEFKKNVAHETKRNRGDQDWMFRHVKDHVFWPDDWIQSYKWEMRDKDKLKKMPDGRRNFVDIAQPKIQHNTCIAVFHGEPNPSECKDPWVVDNWQ